MSPADLVNLLLFARLSAIAYLVDETAAAAQTEAIGCRFVALIAAGDAHALVVETAGKVVVVFRGTPVVENTSAAEILADIATHPANLGPMGRVPFGAWEGLARLVPALIRVLPEAGPDFATGHSLGGWRADMARLYWPRVQVVAFGMPKAGDRAFWLAAYGDAPPDHVIHERDFAPEWPWVNPFGWTSAPGPFQWLTGGGIQETVDRPGLDLSVGDHDVDKGYIAPLAELVVKAPAPVEA